MLGAHQDDAQASRSWPILSPGARPRGLAVIMRPARALTRLALHKFSGYGRLTNAKTCHQRHGQGGPPGRHRAAAAHEQARQPQRVREGPAGLRQRSRFAGRDRDHPRTPPRLSRGRHPGRGIGRHGQGQADLRHRSARRHLQLPARLPAFLHLDRPGRKRRAAPTASSSTRCATNCSPPAAARARCSTTRRSASPSART